MDVFNVNAQFSAVMPGKLTSNSLEKSGVVHDGKFEALLRFGSGGKEDYREEVSREVQIRAGGFELPISIHAEMRPTPQEPVELALLGNSIEVSPQLPQKIFEQAAFACGHLSYGYSGTKWFRPGISTAEGQANPSEYSPGAKSGWVTDVEISGALIDGTMESIGLAVSTQKSDRSMQKQQIGDGYTADSSGNLGLNIPKRFFCKYIDSKEGGVFFVRDYISSEVSVKGQIANYANSLAGLSGKIYKLFFNGKLLHRG